MLVFQFNFALLLSLAVAIHLPHHQLSCSKESYLQALRTVKDQTMPSWQSLNRTLNDGSMQNGSPEERNRMRQTSLRDQYDSLLRIESTSVIPYSSRPCSCNITQNDKDTIFNKLSDINRLIDTLQRDLNSVPNCDRIQLLTKEVGRQRQYVQNMKQVVNPECCASQSIIDPNRFFVSNLDAGNWTLGTIPENEFRHKYEDMKSRPNVEVCPEDRPYALSPNQCVSCQPTQLWDFSTQGCVSCPGSMIYDAGVRKCMYKAEAKKYGDTQYVSDMMAGNLLANSKSFQQYKRQQQELQRGKWEMCPRDRPFLGRQGLCINCPNDYPLLNLDTRDCTKCVPPKGYNSEWKKCLPIIYETNPDAPRLLETDRATVENLKNSIVRRNRENSNNAVVGCPLQTPFFNGTRCTDCTTSDRLFNLETLRCQSCPQPLKYNYKLRKCGNYSYTTSPNAANLFLQGESITTYKKTYEQLINRGQTIDCPDDLPYFNGSECVNCPKNTPIFDVYRKMCISCPQNTQFSQKLNTCVNNGVEVAPTVQRAFMNINIK